MVYIVKINGNEYEVEVEKGKASVVKIDTPSPDNSRADYSASAETAFAADPESEVKAGDGEAIKSPVTGTVLDIRAKPGSRVKKGDILLILEAMKMENEILVPKDGVITDILVAKGSQVSANDVLAVIN